MQRRLQPKDIGRWFRERRYREILEHPPERTLRELRRSCHQSQMDVAASLGIGQKAVSRLEHRLDVRVSTLEAYVGVLGGQLELIVRLPKRAVRLIWLDEE
jgi:transcriptional regulator with XRE-family HTH domain